MVLLKEDKKIMLKYLYATDKNVYTLEEVQQKYKNCKVLLYNLVMTDSELTGNIYAISESEESYRELEALDVELYKRGIETVEVGHYNEGGFVSIQYVM